MALPSGHTSRIARIVTYDGDLEEAFAPQSVTLTLENEIDLSRGEMLVHPDDLPHVGHRFRAMMVWMDEEPLDRSKAFYLKHTTPHDAGPCRDDPPPRGDQRRRAGRG